MTNEEIKKKICKIIADNYLPKEMPDRLEDYKLYRFKRAAALIAAGLTFDGEWKHRAEVAMLAGVILQGELTKVFATGNLELDKKLSSLWALALQQAEKELEGKNE